MQIGPTPGDLDHSTGQATGALKVGIPLRLAGGDQSTLSSNTMSAIHIEEVTTWAALDALRPEWSRLWARCATATPFQLPEWLLPWWKHFGGGELLVLALRCEGRLVGLAPLFIHEQEGRPLRQLSFIGAGISDYLDFLWEPDAALLVTETILPYLAQQRSRWNVGGLQDLRADSPLLTVQAPPELHLEKFPLDVCPVLSLPATTEAFLANLPARQRRNLWMARRRLARADEFHLEMADEKMLPEFLDALFRLHRAGWERRHLPGILAGNQLHTFHREAAAGLRQRGCLRLYGLRGNGEIVAALYAVRDRSRTYAYLSGFEPNLEPFNLDTLIIGHAIEAAIREGVREFDFGRGRDADKYTWGARDQTNYVLLMSPSSSLDDSTTAHRDEPCERIELSPRPIW
jgi:CelD/BcsL family acetyltransferase involved in cellulose biosynthesis